MRIQFALFHEHIYSSTISVHTDHSWFSPTVICSVSRYGWDNVCFQKLFSSGTRNC